VAAGGADFGGGGGAEVGRDGEGFGGEEGVVGSDEDVRGDGLSARPTWRTAPSSEATTVRSTPATTPRI
jgi:hypothetical protein